MIEKLLRLYCSKTDIPYEKIKSKTRKPLITIARQVFCSYLISSIGITSVDIAAYFQMHHTSVLYSNWKTSEQIGIKDKLYCYYWLIIDEICKEFFDCGKVNLRNKNKCCNLEK